MKKFFITVFLLGLSETFLLSMQTLPGSWDTGSLYGLLGVGKNASIQEIEKACESQIKQWHPDKNRDQKDYATQRFQNLTPAKDLLVHSKARALYDELVSHCRKNSNDYIDQEDLHQFFKERLGKEYLNDEAYKKFSRAKDAMKDINWKQSSWFALFKKQSKHGFDCYIEGIPLAIMYLIGAYLSDKIFTIKSKSQKTLEALIKKFHEFGDAIETVENQKDIKIKIKHLRKKILATQQALIAHNLDETQKNKLRMRLKKYTKEWQALIATHDEEMDYFYDDFKAVIENISR
ncbi:MAG: DnaJ domain-containing protein [Candidatus Babeliales bacterium]